MAEGERTSRIAGQELQIEYCAPPTEVVDDFTRAVCEKLGEALAGDLSCTQIRQGFKSFIKTVTAIAAKEANNGRA